MQRSVAVPYGGKHESEAWFFTMNNKALGTNILKARQAKGWTQDFAAEKCGLSENYFRQIELGNKVPRLETFVRIAEMLGVSADFLLYGNLTTTHAARSAEMMDKLSELPPKQQKVVLETVNTLISEIKKNN